MQTMMDNLNRSFLKLISCWHVQSKFLDIALDERRRLQEEFDDESIEQLYAATWSQVLQFHHQLLENDILVCCIPATQ